MHDLYEICNREKAKEITGNSFCDGLKSVLTFSEADLLFKAIDHDKSRTISVEELAAELAVINAAIVFEELRNRIADSKISFDQAFDAVDTNMSGDIDIGEFNEFLQTVYGNCQTREVEILFNSVDKSGNGMLTRNDLKQAIQNELDLKSEVTISYTDIIIPLATTVKTRL